MSRWLRSSSGFATVGVAIAVVAVSLLGLIGVGTDKSLFDFGSGFAWLSSNEQGQALLVNGADGKGTSKLNVPGAKGKRMRVEQRDGHAYVVVDEDGETNVLYRLDDATLTTGSQRRIGKAERIVRGGSSAWLVNEETGVVQPIDADSLEPRGERLAFKGRIDVAAADDGHLVVVELESARASVVENGSAGEPIPVGSAGDDLKATVAGGRVAIVNVSKSEVTRFEGKTPGKIVIPAGAGELLVPESGESDEVVMLRRDGDRGELVRVSLKDGGVSKVRVEAPVRGVKPPLATPDAVFLVDPGAGQITTVNPNDGSTVSTVDAEVGRGGDLEAFVKDGYLWLNNPGGSKAVVVDRHGRKKDVDKYDQKVPVINPETPPDQPPSDTPPPSGPPAPTPGAAAPGDGAPSPTPPPTVTTPPPVANAPGMPTSFRGTPSNKSVSLSWNAPASGGAPIEGYTLTCNPDCGGGQASLPLGNVQTTVVRDLENGKPYDFTLTASNSIGTGPPASVNGIKPTGDVPSAPTQVTAKEQPDGTVTVSWKEDAAGLSLTGYEIVATSDSTTLPAGSPTSKTFTVNDAQAPSYTTKPDDLGYDDDSTPDWSFTVKAKATKDGQPVESTASDPSNKVDVYTKPAFTTGVTVTGSGADGSANLSWPTANANGRTVTYTVTQCVDPCAGSYAAASVSVGPRVQGRQVTATVGGGLTNFKQYDFRVVASNDAGDSQPITSSPVKPHKAPTISVTPRNSGSNQSTIFVDVATDFAGDPNGSCVETSPYNGPVACSGTVSAGGLSPGTGYTFRICARNSAGDPDVCSLASVSTAAPPPPPPSIQVYRGAAASVSGCTNNCYRVHVKLVNIGTPVTVQCSDYGGVFYTYTAKSADTEVCAYGYSGQNVTVTAGGASATYRWP